MEIDASSETIREMATGPREDMQRLYQNVYFLYLPYLDADERGGNEETEKVRFYREKLAEMQHVWSMPRAEAALWEAQITMYAANQDAELLMEKLMYTVHHKN